MEDKLDAAWSSSVKVCKWISFGEKIVLATGLFVQVHPARYKKYYFGIKSDFLQKKTASNSLRIFKTPPFIHIGACSYIQVVHSDISSKHRQDFRRCLQILGLLKQEERVGCRVNDCESI